MLTEAIVAHCAPTLARLKPGSLFTVEDTATLADDIAGVNRDLTAKGLCLTHLRSRDGKALLYLYRESALSQLLSCPLMQAFLRKHGYARFALPDALTHLRQRLAESDGFPHEIGVFLGYPLPDVEGFIRHGGRDFLCSGCWKVYDNACEAQRLFARYHKCRRVYADAFASGIPLRRLAVATVC